MMKDAKRATIVVETFWYKVPRTFTKTCENYANYSDDICDSCIYTLLYTTQFLVHLLHAFFCNLMEQFTNYLMKLQVECCSLQNISGASQ